MRTWNEEKKQWVGMKGNELCEGSRICKCSLIAGNTVPNPECPVHVVAHDSVNHPKHYTSHPSGVECITVTEHMNFNIGNAIKYLWRADHKNGIEDLRKAAWYINREIQRQTAVPAPQAQPK